MRANLVLATLNHVWRVLRPFNLPMAVMGGVALATWQHLRATRDVDLLVALGNTDLAVLLERLEAAGIRPKRQPPVLTLGSLRLLQLEYQPPGSFVDVQVDLLFGDSAYHGEALARRVPVHLAELDVEIAVLACEDLILHKLLAGRIIDRADAAALLRLNRASLDFAYLLKWIRDLGVGAEFAEVWNEAFPAEAVPVSEDAHGD